MHLSVEVIYLFIIAFRIKVYLRGLTGQWQIQQLDYVDTCFVGCATGHIELSSCSVFVAQYDQYTEVLIEHLVNIKSSHWDGYVALGVTLRFQQRILYLALDTKCH